jgi:Dihydroxyacid dehydratase/phosphogluconate dehydratase
MSDSQKDDLQSRTQSISEGTIMELRSQAVRKLAPENDPLKIGMGWKVDDLAKPQIMVESTFGDRQPGSAHLDQYVQEAVQAIQNPQTGRLQRYFANRYVQTVSNRSHDELQLIS